MKLLPPLPRQHLNQVFFSQLELVLDFANMLVKVLFPGQKHEIHALVGLLQMQVLVQHLVHLFRSHLVVFIRGNFLLRVPRELGRLLPAAYHSMSRGFVRGLGHHSRVAQLLVFDAFFLRRLVQVPVSLFFFLVGRVNVWRVQVESADFVERFLQFFVVLSEAFDDFVVFLEVPFLQI